MDKSLLNRVLKELERPTEVRLFPFTSIFLSHHLTLPPARFHLDIYRLNENPAVKRLAIAAPRFFAKSSICAFFTPLWAALTGKASTFSILSETESLSQSILRKIRSELEENALLRHYYGDQRGRPWRESEIGLKNGSYIRAVGSGYQVRGFHPEWLVITDLEGDEEVSSDVLRPKLEDWFWGALMPSVEGSKKVVIESTIFDERMILKKLIDKPPEGWVCRRYQAITDGQSIWPEKLSTEELRRISRERPRVYFGEYQQEPTGSMKSQFDPAWFRFYDELPREAMNYFIGVDPSNSTDGDAKALVVLAVNARGQYFEIAHYQAHIGVRDFCEKICDFFLLYSPDMILIESDSEDGTSPFTVLLLEVASQRKVFLPITEHHPCRSKIRRAQALALKMEIGAFFLRRASEHSALHMQLKSFPMISADHLVDATVYAILCSYRPESVEADDDEEEWFVAQNRHRMKGIDQGSRREWYAVYRRFQQKRAIEEVGGPLLARPLAELDGEVINQPENVIPFL